LLVAGAVAASQGRLNIVAVVLVAFLAAVAGNTLGYLIGRWGGRSLLARFKVKGDRLARLEKYFQRYGPGVVLVSRFFDGLRQLNGIVAGMLNMNAKVFNAVNIGGAVLWVGVWGLGPFFLGEKIRTMHLAFRALKPWALVVSLIAFIGLLVYLLWSRRSRPPQIKSPSNR
jgi:membrane protein DedA with SNARE-associated domain